MTDSCRVHMADTESEKRLKLIVGEWFMDSVSTDLEIHDVMLTWHWRRTWRVGME